MTTLRRITGGGRARLALTQVAPAGAVALALGCLLVGPTVLLHPGRGVVGVNPSSDFQIMAWSLEWWPWAVRHGVDPFRTRLLWPPEGFSTLWMTSIPGPALLALPVTLTVGSLAAYNVLMLLAVALAAAAAFLLCRELTGRFVPSLLGGLLFAFCPYMLGHTLSEHLDLTFVFPVPLLALLVVRYVRGRTSARRFVAGFGTLLLVQLGSSFELFLDVTLLVAVGSALAILGGGPERRRFVRAGGLVALAYGLCLPVLVPVAVLAFSAPHAALHHVPANYATDLLNLVVPTPTLLAGTFEPARALSQHFVGNIGEQDGYLGLPLLAVTVLAVRAGRRCGAWLAGGLLAIVIALSLGPTLTIGGRPLVSLPFTLVRLPLLGDALPARMSLFAALAASCLCAVWLARPRPRALQIAVGALVVLSLLPNFRPAKSLEGAWAISDAFGWSTSRVPRGFVDARAWTRIVRPGANVLVLPPGDRTTAGYWQARTAMRFSLTVPATPFAPPRMAATPVVVGLVDDNLPKSDGRSLAASRLRAFLRADGVRDVVVTHRALRRWRRVVADATAATPVTLAGASVYPVPSNLGPLTGRGHFAVAKGTRAWVRFDGRRAHVRALLRGAHHAVTLSSPSGDADFTAVAAGKRGNAAVVFTEWRAHHVLLRVATRSDGRWRIVTLDRRAEPIWSPRVAITPQGTTLAAWIDEADPTRAVRVAALRPGGSWQRPVTLENADGLGSVALASSTGDRAVGAWRDALAGESRVRVATYDAGRWSAVTTLASSLDDLDHVTIARRTLLVRWQR